MFYKNQEFMESSEVDEVPFMDVEVEELMRHQRATAWQCFTYGYSYMGV